MNFTWKFYAEHNGVIAIFCEKFQNDWADKEVAVDKSGFWITELIHSP